MKSTFRSLFYLRKNEVNKSGNCAIMVRITINGDKAQFSSKLQIKPELWDAKSGRAIGRTAEATNVNRLLDSMSVNIDQLYYKLLDEYGYVLPEKIKNLVLGIERNSKTLLEYIELHNEQYKNRIGINTSNTTYIRYELLKQRIIDFLRLKYKVSDIPLRDLTPIVLDDFYLYLRKECKCNNNSSMKIIQRLRKIFNYAKNSGINISDPFLSFKVRFESVDREILTQEEIDRLYKKEFLTERLEQVRDVFIFSCYTGLSYIDIVSLQDENIRESFDGNLWIMIKRQKTNVGANIRLLDIPKAILNKYKGKQRNGNVLPVATNQKVNEYLKETAAI